MRTVWVGLLVALVASAAVVIGQEQKPLSVAILTDSRGAPRAVFDKSDVKLQDGTVIPYPKLWPAVVAGLQWVSVEFPAQGARIQEISAVPALLEKEGKVYDLLILHCGLDEYYSPEGNKAKLQARVEGGRVDARFVEDLKQRDYDIRGSDLEKNTFERLRKYATKIVYVASSRPPYDVSSRENERFKQLGVFDRLIELPLRDEWIAANTWDGVHYNEAGHTFVSGLVVAAISETRAASK